MQLARFGRAQTTHYGLVIVGSFILVPSPQIAAQGPASVDLPGVIRDFSREHVDFNVTPAAGYGYYSGNVALDLDEEGKPLFTGEGFKLRFLWTNEAGRPIAPHLFNTCGIFGGDDGGSGRTSFYLTVDERVKLDKSSEIDSFDSNVGPYGEENVGDNALLRVNGRTDKKHYVVLKNHSTIKGDVLVNPDDDPEKVVRLKKGSTVTGDLGRLETVLDIPAVLPPEMPDVEFVEEVKFKRGVHTIDSDLRCEELKLKKGAIVNIEGDVTIWCDEELKLDDESQIRVLAESHVTIYVGKKLELDDGSEIQVLDDAHLTIYAGEKITVDDGSKINMNSGNPQLVDIHMLSIHEEEDDDDDDDDDDDGDDDDDDGDSRMVIDDRGQVAAWVQGADASLKLDDGSEFFGSFIGRRVELKDESRLHVDMATAGEGSGGGGGGDGGGGTEECDLGDNAGVFGRASTGDVVSVDTFAQWWRDILGVNLSGIHTMTLVRNGGGVYQCFINDWRPIDGQLLGNEGDNHNYHFTFEVAADFTYMAGAGQFVEFRGTDDTYIFINGKLVLDLGGMGFNKVQYVDLDRLGLEDGQRARLQLFHAQRQRGLAIFRLQTNLVLEGTGTPLVTAGTD